MVVHMADPSSEAEQVEEVRSESVGHHSGEDKTSNNSGDKVEDSIIERYREQSVRKGGVTVTVERVVEIDGREGIEVHDGHKRWFIGFPRDFESAVDIGDLYQKLTADALPRDITVYTETNPNRCTIQELGSDRSLFYEPPTDYNQEDAVTIEKPKYWTDVQIYRSGLTATIEAVSEHDENTAEITIAVGQHELEFYVDGLGSTDPSVSDFAALVERYAGGDVGALADTQVDLQPIFRASESTDGIQCKNQDWLLITREDDTQSEDSRDFFVSVGTNQYMMLIVNFCVVLFLFAGMMQFDSLQSGIEIAVYSGTIVISITWISYILDL